MATHSSILALGNPVDREAWRLKVYGVAKKDSATQTTKTVFKIKYISDNVVQWKLCKKKEKKLKPKKTLSKINHGRIYDCKKKKSVFVDKVGNYSRLYMGSISSVDIGSWNVEHQKTIAKTALSVTSLPNLHAEDFGPGIAASMQ